METRDSAKERTAVKENGAQIGRHLGLRGNELLEKARKKGKMNFMNGVQLDLENGGRLTFTQSDSLKFRLPYLVTISSAPDLNTNEQLVFSYFFGDVEKEDGTPLNQMVIDVLGKVKSEVEWGGSFATERHTFTDDDMERIEQAYIAIDKYIREPSSEQA